MNESAERLFASEHFTTSATRYSVITIELTIGDLGFPQGASSAEMYARAAALGLVVRAVGGFKQLLLPKPPVSRRRRKGVIWRIQVWLARLGLAVVLCTILSIVLWWQAHSQSPAASTRAAEEIVSSESPSPSPTISRGIQRVVANTRGLGVRFRQEPQQDASSSIAIPEGTIVYVIEQLQGSDGELWWKVRLEDGSLGYIKDQYLGR